jgi:uncharacterized protein (DUF885 family)
MSRVPRLTALALATSLWAAVPVPARAQSAAAPASAAAASQALRSLFAEEWERGLRDHPENASYQGDTRFNDRWTDNSLPAIAAREAADRAALLRLQAIPRAGLSPAEQIDRDTFEWLQQRSVERQRFREHLQAISHQGGITTADAIAEVMPFATPTDYRQYLARLAALPQLVDQTLVLMREGVKAGIVPPRVLMQRVPAQIAAQLADDPQRSPFYKPFTRFPLNFPVAERVALQAQAQATLRDQVVPAYRRLQTAFLNDYLPHTRNSVAATDRPDGPAYYDFLARGYTTTDLSADAIHELGLKEVARIRAAMERVKLEAGYSGTLEDFFTFLRSDPRFFLKTPAELLTAYRAVAKRIDPELVKVFRTIPRLPYGVKGIPDSIAPDTTTAYYQPAAADGSRAGIYYVNLYKPEARPTWEMVPLSLHEAVPGHHFQFARALELPDAPQFRRTAYFVAYSEGWGLYAEQLGHEMGLYDDPYDRFGQLTYEMWRAVRLVVDTGMHTQGWTRERSIAYFKANAAKTEQDIVNEIDRYINTPAQALAYKVGQLQISALRTRAQQALGARFDLRDFHDAVLATGSVPLAALQARIEAWIVEQQRRPPG